MVNARKWDIFPIPCPTLPNNCSTCHLWSQLYTQKTRWWFLQKPPTISRHPLPHVCGSAVGCAVRTATTTIPTQQAGVFSGNRSNLPYMTYNCNGCCFNLSEKASKHPKFPSPHFFFCTSLGFMKLCFVQIALYCGIHPSKLTWHPNNEGLEDESPFQIGDFQVPC